jgi:hypothetical protein
LLSFPDFVPRQRRTRTKFSPIDLAKLEALFKSNNYPGITEREALALEIGIGEGRIQVIRLTGPARPLQTGHL